jgi:hypothetical protein
MYCEQLEQLLDEHSSLTMLLFRQEGRTQGWYRTEEEWECECEKLRSVEQELAHVTAELAQHRRQHGCGAAEWHITTEDTESLSFRP